MQPLSKFKGQPMLEQARALKQLQGEINDSTIYSILAEREKNPQNAEVLRKIADQEMRHYHFCEKITGEARSAQRIVVWFYIILVKIFGSNFALKLMESREVDAQQFYLDIKDQYPEAGTIYQEESQHETELISMLEDPVLINAGGIVLGMNDALVELTGALSGIALAFDNVRLIGSTGFIMGVAASLSMAGSAYLESKENPSPEIKPLTYSLYTGFSYIITTLLLIAPFFIFSSVALAITAMFCGALAEILLYNFYISVAKDLKFWPRVIQMCSITFGVAVISFGIGLLVKQYFGLDI